MGKANDGPGVKAVKKMQFHQFDKVRVRHISWLRRFLTDGPKRKMRGEIGTIMHSEIGQYSREPLYSVVFESGGGGCFFEDELELISPTT